MDKAIMKIKAKLEAAEEGLEKLLKMDKKQDAKLRKMEMMKKSKKK